MLEKFLNKKVEILYTTYNYRVVESGIITNIDENFIELDNNKVLQIKFICTIRVK